MSLFFPPFRTGESGSTPLHCARKRDSCAAHFSERPARLKTHIYVHAAGAAGLGPAAKPYFFEESLDFQSHPANIGPAHTRHRIEIDAQFIGVIEIAGANRVWVQFDASEINNPSKPSHIIHDDFFRSSA